MVTRQVQASNQMDQPIPHYSDEDLERIIARDYPAQLRADVEALLQSYGDETWHNEPLRVRMACLKLAGGDLVTLKRYLRDAGMDYRDVLAWAEYPAYMRAHGPDEQRKAIESDWEQLQTWRHRK
jgi:hypothetical protein